MPTKKGEKRIEFKDGSNNSKNKSAATFTTASTSLQKAIEASKYFVSGKIILTRTSEVATEKQTTTPYPKVENMQNARDVLMDLGVELKELSSKAVIKEKATEMNISFPNWK